ncbi:MAG: porin family protein [Cytophagaceae bacterium]|nr:MAG: porin family protein [Cytophagaceae bacterium]
MKFIALAAAALFATATPALAQDNAGFTGARIEATAGYNDIIDNRDFNDVVYGVEAGVDVPVGDKFTLGVAANTRNVFERNRQIGATARVGYAFNRDTLGYALAGYNNYRSFERFDRDGLAVGGGIEHLISDQTYVKAEYRYSDFDGRTGDSAVTAGIGLRF